jgi:hypothetical protein
LLLTTAKRWVFAGELKEVLMRKLLIGSAVISAAMVATPAAAQIYINVGHSPYSYGYSPYSSGYSPYGYSPYSYGYRPYSYGYAAPAYGYGYSNYAYSSPYGYHASYKCVRRHHRNGVVYYTRVC